MLSVERGVSSPTATMPRRRSSSASNSASNTGCISVKPCVPRSSAAVLKCRSRAARESSSAFSLSPAPAAEAMVKGWAVIVARGVSRTPGLTASRSRTIAAALSMACASWTEVPPNFITIIGARSPSRSTEVSLSVEKLAVQNCSAGRAANHVVREQRKFPVKDIAGPQPSDHGSHAASAIHVKPRLRTVRRGLIDHWLLRRGRQLQFLRQTAKLVPRRDDLCFGRWRTQLERDRLHMSVFHGHAITVCAQHQIGEVNPVAIHRSQQLARFRFHLWFFTRNVGNYIAEHVARRHASISRAAG